MELESTSLELPEMMLRLSTLNSISPVLKSSKWIRLESTCLALRYSAISNMNCSGPQM